MSELKPCPFCGGEVELRYVVEDRIIDCPMCGEKLGGDAS